MIKQIEKAVAGALRRRLRGWYRGSWLLGDGQAGNGEGTEEEKSASVSPAHR